MVQTLSNGEDVYCTLLMSDSYLPGVAVLASSLRDCGTKKKLACLVTLDSLLYDTITELKTLFDYVIPVDKVANPNLENLVRLDRLDLRFAFTKIGLWRQTQFRKIVYIDADIVALRAPDELFSLDVPFAAAPDIGWPDCFNTGLMLLEPNMGDYWSLQTLASSGSSFDGADQGLLNEYYDGRDWHRLSFTYNCTPSPSYQYEPAYRHFRSSIKLVHFIGKQKPWQMGRNAIDSAGSGAYKELLGRWWSVYDRHYQHQQTSALGQVKSKDVIQRYVKDERTHSAIAWAAAGHVPTIPSISVSAASTGPGPAVPDEPLMDPGELAENIDQGVVQPQTTSEQRRFSAPQNEWDATRSEPPMQSRPEASGFPTQQYEMSTETGLFKAPQSYPEPPTDMYYKVPETKPALYEAPKPIFPWEQQHSSKRVTRIFAEDTSQPSPEIVSKPPSTKHVPKPSTDELIRPDQSAEWNAYSRSNAWDNVDSIDQYVRAFKLAQAARGKPIDLEALANLPKPAFKSERKESLVLTDFPTEVERPSLPVTPNPIRRPVFWGSEKDEELPPAQGVPHQTDWNPVEQLEQLRRNSLLTASGQVLSPSREAPLRDVPSSAPISSSQLGLQPESNTTSSTEATAAVKPALREPSFTSPSGKSAGAEDTELAPENPA